VSPPRPPLLHRPGGRHLAHALALAAAVSLWWGLVYGGADYATGRHGVRVRLHLPWEPRVPLVPAAVLGYLSVNLLFVLAPFVLRTGRQLRAFAATLALAVLAAGPCFLLLPAAAAFPPLGDLGAWDGPVRFAKAVALTNNYFPSLHVALAVASVGVYAGCAGGAARAALWLWAAVIAASTVLLHQHYVVDVVAGWAVGLACVRWGYRRWAGSGDEAANAAGQPVHASSAAGLMSPAFCPRARQRRS
jgi:membrane-associated phospholipid phosphatase